MATVKIFTAFLVFFSLYMHDVAMGQSCDRFSKGDPEKKEFYSPYHPNNYQNNMNCELQLTAPWGFVIRVRFHEFTLETCSTCSCDHVEINEGNSSHYTMIGEKYCATNRPPTITSKGRQLYLKFRSDSSNVYSGFRASYEFLGVKTGVLAIPGVSEARDRGIRWLRERAASPPKLRSEDLSPRAAVALRLAAAVRFDGSLVEEELLTQNAELKTAVSLLRSPIPANTLSLFVNALLASCHNPRHFYGHNLVDRLRAQSLSTPGLTHPSVYTALCNAREPWPEKAARELQQTLNSSSIHPFLADIQAMAVAAVACMTNSSKSFNASNHPTLFADYEFAINSFRHLRHSDGSFGNLYTTALIVQALIASGKQHDPSWNLTSTVEFMIRETRKPSVDLLAMYFTLPVFSGRSFADIWHMNCSRRNKGEDEIVPEVDEFMGPKMRVEYSLFVGDRRDVIHTVSLRVPVNFTALQVMRYAAAEDAKYKFEWRQVGERMYVYEIAGVTNDPEMGHFWITYVGTSNGTDSLEPTNSSPERLILQDEQKLVMWYRSAHI